MKSSGFIALLIASVLALGCGSDAGGANGGSSTLTILLTDGADETLTAAVVTIEEIYLQGGGDDDDADDDDKDDDDFDDDDDGCSDDFDDDDKDDDDEGGRIVLRSDPVTTDLLSLSNDVDELVDEATVPDGAYSQLRFVISGAYIEVLDTDGVTRVFATEGYDAVPDDLEVDGELKTPSWDSSGLKVKLPNECLDIEGEQRILVVDFDVSESIGHETGSGDWVMHPVLEAFDVLVSGSIEIVATPSDDVSDDEMNDVDVALEDANGDAEGVLSLADADDDGVFTAFFAYLNPAESPFTVTLVDEVDDEPVTTDPEMPLTIPLESGEIERREVTVLEVP